MVLQYVQRRRFDCVNMTSNEVVPFISCTGALPDLGDVECSATITCIPDANGNYVPDVASIPDGQLPSPVSPGVVLDTQTAGDSSAGQQQANGDTGTAVDAGSTGSTGVSDTSTGVGGDVAKPPDASGNGPSFHASEGGANAGAPTDNNSSGSTTGSPAAQSPQSASSTPAAADTTTSSLAGSNASDSSGNIASSPAAGASSSDTTSSDPSNVSTGSGTTADAGNASGNNGVTVPAVQPVSNDPVLQLGPGQVVPGWLFDNPTPNLQSVLRCPPGHAVTPDGTCCSGKCNCLTLGLDAVSVTGPSAAESVDRTCLLASTLDIACRRQLLCLDVLLFLCCAAACRHKAAYSLSDTALPSYVLILQQTAWT